jgi:hypothetical protein
MRSGARSAGAAALLLLAATLGGAAGAAQLDFATTLGEEVVANGLLDPGETLTIDLSATYAAGEEAVNYQVDLLLSGDLASFSFSPQDPLVPFGSPGSAPCAAPLPDRLRCFGTANLLLDPNARVGSPTLPVTVPLGSVQIQALAGPGDALTVAPGPFFTEELTSDPNGQLVGSALPFVPQGLDAGGNVVDLITGSGPPPDSDGDGVPDDGDGSGTAGDNPCPDGVTSDCDDSCRYEPNAGQENAAQQPNQVSTALGDACECGDVNDDGLVTGTDFTLIKITVASAGTSTPFVPPRPDKCDVTGDSLCTGTDFTVVKIVSAGTNAVLLQPARCPAILP